MALMAMIKKMKQERLTARLIQHGGAERLIVDAAIKLASHGHNVHIFTTRDENHVLRKPGLVNHVLRKPKLVSFLLQYMVTSYHDIFSIVFMLYAYIYVASLLLFVYYSCGHHLMFY